MSALGIERCNCTAHARDLGQPHILRSRPNGTGGKITESHGAFYCESVETTPTGRVVERKTIWPPE